MIKLNTAIRNKMRKDIEEINNFTLAETKKWSDKEVAEYYASSMQTSLFNDSMVDSETGKPMFPKLYKPSGHRKADHMKNLLKQAGLSVA